MMRIDNLQLRFNDLLLPQREPGRVGVTRAGWRIACRTSARGAPCSERSPRRMTAPPHPTARPSRSAMSGATQTAVERSFRSSLVPSKASNAGAFLTARLRDDRASAAPSPPPLDLSYAPSQAAQRLTEVMRPSTRLGFRGGLRTELISSRFSDLEPENRIRSTRSCLAQLFFKLAKTS